MISVENLSKRYGSTVAVDGLSFEARPGSVLGFLGPNGAGKTTTLRILLGLARPTRGTATIEGIPYASLEDPSATVGAVLDSSGFHPGRSGRNHLRVIARGAGIPDSRVDELLRLVDLEEGANRRVKGYSMGMKQRLNLAGALLGDPRVLILDEPANGLDPQGIRWLRDFLRGLAGEGRTVLVSSHVLAEVAQTVDEVVVIHKGRVRAHSSLAELTSRGGPGASVRVRSPDAERLAALVAEAGGTAEATEPSTLIVTGTPAERVGEVAAADGLVLHELVALGDASLEDVFLELTRESGGGPDNGAP